MSEAEKMKRLGLYMLDADNQVVLAPDVLTWGEAFGTCNKRVDTTTLSDSVVSTIFLGIAVDSYTLNKFLGRDDVPPLLFETAVFSTKDVGAISVYKRYATWAEAQAGHRACVDAYLISRRRVGI